MKALSRRKRSPEERVSPEVFRDVSCEAPARPFYPGGSDFAVVGYAFWMRLSESVTGEFAVGFGVLPRWQLQPSPAE